MGIYPEQIINFVYYFIKIKQFYSNNLILVSTHIIFNNPSNFSRKSKNNPLNRKVSETKGKRGV